MHARITTVTGASDLDGGFALLLDEGLPQLRAQRGFCGLRAAADRDAGVATVLSLWESEADLDASESSAAKTRAEVIRAMGGDSKIERYEQIVWIVCDSQPGLGSKLHLRRFTIDSTRVVEKLEFFRQTVLPEITARPGFMALSQLINRATGEGRVGSVWADEDSLRASLAQSEARRAAAGPRGIEFGEDRVLDVVFNAI